MVNNFWLDVMPTSAITYLPFKGSDHYPLLLEMFYHISNPLKYFKFPNFWVDNSTFTDTVKQSWSRHVEGDPMWSFYMKLKRVSHTLSAWSRKEYGDIHAVRVREEGSNE